MQLPFTVFLFYHAEMDLESRTLQYHGHTLHYITVIYDHDLHDRWVRIPLEPQNFFWALVVTAISTSSNQDSQDLMRHNKSRADKEDLLQCLLDDMYMTKII